MSQIEDIHARLDVIAERIEAAKRKLHGSPSASESDFTTAETFEQRYRDIRARLKGETEADDVDTTASQQQDVPVPLLDQTTFEADLTKWLLELDERFNQPPHRVQSASV